MKLKPLKFVAAYNFSVSFVSYYLKRFSKILVRILYIVVCTVECSMFVSFAYICGLIIFFFCGQPLVNYLYILLWR